MVQHSNHQPVKQLLSNLTKFHKRHSSYGKTIQQTIQSERNLTLNTSNSKQTQKNSILTLLKSQVQYKVPWKGSGLIHNDNPLKRLSHKYEMDNWEISRIELSKRSYKYPKQYKGLKIPEKGRQFNNFTQRDKQGHLPYLYQNQIKKYESIKQKLHITPFKLTNSVRHDYFGFGTHKYLNRKQPKIKSEFIKNKDLVNLTNIT